MPNLIQGISDAIADRPDLDLTQRMLLGLDNWPLSYRIGYRLFCRCDEENENDSIFGLTVTMLLFCLLIWMMLAFM